jgi:hypothetical protein
MVEERGREGNKSNYLKGEVCLAVDGPETVVIGWTETAAIGWLRRRKGGGRKATT